MTKEAASYLSSPPPLLVTSLDANLGKETVASKSALVPWHHFKETSFPTQLTTFPRGGGRKSSLSM